MLHKQVNRKETETTESALCLFSSSFFQNPNVFFFLWVYPNTYTNCLSIYKLNKNKPLQFWMTSYDSVVWNNILSYFCCYKENFQVIVQAPHAYTQIQLFVYYLSRKHKRLNPGWVNQSTGEILQQGCLWTQSTVHHPGSKEPAKWQVTAADKSWLRTDECKWSTINLRMQRHIYFYTQRAGAGR